MLKLPNLVDDVMEKYYDVIVLTSKDIIKIITIYIKTIFKDSKEFKRVRNYVSKCNLYLFLQIAKFVFIIGEKNADVSRTQGVCHVIHIFFGSSLGKV